MGGPAASSAKMACGVFTRIYTFIFYQRFYLQGWNAQHISEGKVAWLSHTPDLTIDLPPQ
jgi:hypothetical protein